MDNEEDILSQRSLRRIGGGAGAGEIAKQEFGGVFGAAGDSELACRQLEEHGECRAPACDYCGPIVGLNRGAEDAGWVGREGYGRHGGQVVTVLAEVDGAGRCRRIGKVL